MFVVYKKAKGKRRVYIAEFSTEREAIAWCDSRLWKSTDKNGFSWWLAYVEV